MILLLFAQLETAIKAIDHVSEQSLLWVVIALMCCMGGFAWLVINYFVTRTDARLNQDKLSADAHLIAAIENTQMLREVRDVLNEVRRVMVQI